MENVQKERWQRNPNPKVVPELQQKLRFHGRMFAADYSIDYVQQ